MSGLLQRQEAYFLGKLKQAKNHRLSRTQFMRIPFAVEKFDALDPETATRVRDMLAAKGLVEQIESRWGVSFRMTKKGQDYLSTLKPHRRFAPKTSLSDNNGQLPYQRAFLLVKFLRNDNHQLTRSQLQRLVNVKDAREKLGISKKSKGGKATFDPNRLERLIDHLLETGALRETHRGSLQLTEAGEEILGATDQSPDIRVALRGDELNRLLEAARNAGAGLTVDEETAAAESDS